MEAKKNPRVDIHANSGFFLSIGYLISLSLVVLAFEWRSYDPGVGNLGEVSDDFEEQLDIPLTVQPPPPPPPELPPQFIEVPDEEVIEEEDIELDVEITEELVVEEIIYEEPEEEETDEIFLFVEDRPEPDGGYKALYGYINSSIRYPRQATKLGIEGKVYVSFVVERNGSISDVKVIKGIGGGCDAEALRVLANCPIKWKPGKQRGKPVRTHFSINIRFSLQ